MAVPTQALPSWLTLSTHLSTLPGGSVLTSSTTVELPRTYFGPSIPLGTNGVWTFGGSTSPKSTQTASTATATPTSSVSSSSSSPSIQSTLTTAILTPTSTNASSSASSSLNKNALIAIVVVSILGSLVLLFLLFLRWRRRRENRYQTPIWNEWEIVNPTPSQDNGNGDRQHGEGSPRGSSEEVDSLLKKNSGSTAMADIGRGPISVPAAGAAAGTSAAAGAPASGSNNGTNNSGGSGDLNTDLTVVSNYGVFLHGSRYTP